MKLFYRKKTYREAKVYDKLKKTARGGLWSV
jgi:hypothetical protein